MSDALLQKALKLTWEISILKINATQAAQKHKNFPSFNSFFLPNLFHPAKENLLLALKVVN